jgi:glycosyltransferase involved in cell wall biosynthesis
MIEQPLVSIVLPVYNGGRLIGKSIESCLRQTYQNIEVIVVDDGSKDNTVEVAKSFEDDRIKILCHETNRRMCAALNTGFVHSSGAYLTWTSDDNYYGPTAIEEMVDYLSQHPDIDFVFANQYDVDGSGQIIGETIPGPFDKLTEWCCGSAAFLYRRFVYEKLGGYDEKFPLAQDWDYWWRANRHFKLGHLDRFLYYVFTHPGAQTNRFNTEIIEEGLAVQRKNLDRRNPNERIALYKSHIYAAGRLLVEKGDRRRAARAVLWAIFFNPKAIMQYSNLALIAAIGLRSNSRAYRLLKSLTRRAAPDVTAS